MATSAAVATSRLGPELREPGLIMTAEGMRALKPSRLSVTRSLVRRMAQERWQIVRDQFDLDDGGRGTVIYRIRTSERVLSFVVFADRQPPSKHREGATARCWDAVGFLGDEDISSSRLSALRPELPNRDDSEPSKYLTGRADSRTIGFTRAMLSGRAFDHVVDQLAAGTQPDVEVLSDAGYIVRNRGFFGNGRHGTQMYDDWPITHPLYVTHHAQALALFMWRQFGLDLAHHLAKKRSGRAATLEVGLARFLGVGNQSGMGLIRFLLVHPRLTHTLTYLRESALRRISAAGRDDATTKARTLVDLHSRAIRFYRESPSRLDATFARASLIAKELATTKHLAAEYAERGTILGESTAKPWAALRAHALSLHLETQELLHALLIEVHPEVTDPLIMQMRSDERTDVQPEMPLSDLHDIVHGAYGWALDMDTESAAARHYFYYLSSLNREPRFGVRGREPGTDHPEYLDIPGSVKTLAKELEAHSPSDNVAFFLACHPEQRFIVERTQSLARYPYAEVRANLFAETFKPISIIRFVKSWFGTERSETFGVRWIRGTLLQGAATADDVAYGNESPTSCPFPSLGPY